MRKQILALTLFIAASFPAYGQRTISVPDTASWQHARSKIILPPKLAGLKRGTISDGSTSELDVSIRYEDATSIGTVYLYRPYWNDIGVWFDRSEQGILANKKLGNAVGLKESPTLFARPGGTVKSGLFRLYSIPEGAYRTTALAILPIGDWFLKVRYSTPDSDVALVESKFMEIIAKIRTPADASEGASPTTIPACAVPTKWRNAKLIAPTMMGTMIEGATFMAMMEERKAKFLTLPNACRDGIVSELYTMYRDSTDNENFVMAAGDSGFSVQVVQAKSPLFSGTQYWPIASAQAQHMLLPAFNKLPSPEKLFAVVASGETRALVNDDPDVPADKRQESVITVSPDSRIN